MSLNFKIPSLYAIAGVSLFLLLVLLGTIIGYNSLKDPGGNQDSNNQKRECILVDDAYYYGLLTGTRAPSPGEVWVEHYVQPTVLGYEENKGINYLIGGLPDSEDNCVEVRFIVSGEIPVESTSDLLNDFEDTRWGSSIERIDFEDLQRRVEVGSQVRIKYLSKAPRIEELNDELCNKYDSVSQRLCTIQRIQQEYLDYGQVELLRPDNIEDYPLLFGSSYDLELVLTGEPANE